MINNQNDLLSMIALYNSFLGIYNTSLNTGQDENQQAIIARLDKIESDLEQIKAAILKE